MTPPRRPPPRPPFLLACLLLAPTLLGAQHFPPDPELEPMVRFIAEDGGAPGVVFGVLEADGTTRVVSYGSGGPGVAPLGPRSVFEIASITKPFTAILLAHMVLQGEVSLEDPVSMYLPDHVRVPTHMDRELTLLDLATHTSGLPAMPDNLGPRNPVAIYPQYDVDDLYAFLTSQAERGLPPTEYLYSNVGYGLLGHVLARAAGTSYRALLRERILDPLGMDDTDVATTDGASDRLVHPHRRGEPAPWWQGTEAFQGAGALRSTAEDMLKFVRANVGEPRTDLERAMRLAHQVRVPVGGVGRGGHAMAWRVIEAPGQPTLVMHGGVSAGMSGRVAFQPDVGVGSILLTNEFTFTFHHGGGAGLLFPLPPDGKWAGAPVASQVLARYEGRYTPTPGRGRYDVRLDDDRLTLTPRGRDPSALFPTSDTTFYLLGSPLALTFRPADGGDGWVMEARDRDDDGAAPRWVAQPAPARFPPGGPIGWVAILLLGALVVVTVTRVRGRGAR